MGCGSSTGAVDSSEQYVDTHPALEVADVDLHQNPPPFDPAATTFDAFGVLSLHDSCTGDVAEEPSGVRSALLRWTRSMEAKLHGATEDPEQFLPDAVPPSTIRRSVGVVTAWLADQQRQPPPTPPPADSFSLEMPNEHSANKRQPTVASRARKTAARVVDAVPSCDLGAPQLLPHFVVESPCGTPPQESLMVGLSFTVASQSHPTAKAAAASPAQLPSPQLTSPVSTSVGVQ